LGTSAGKSQHSQQIVSPKNVAAIAFLIYEQADACDNQNHASKYSRKFVGNPLGTDFAAELQGEFRVQQISLHRNRRNAQKEIAEKATSRDRLCGGRLSRPSAPCDIAKAKAPPLKASCLNVRAQENLLSVCLRRPWNSIINTKVSIVIRQSRCQPRLDKNGNTEPRAKKTKATK